MDLSNKTKIIDKKINQDGSITIIFGVSDKNFVNILSDNNALPESQEVDALSFIENIVGTQFSIREALEVYAKKYTFSEAVSANLKVPFAWIPEADVWVGAAIDWLIKGESWHQAYISNRIAASMGSLAGDALGKGASVFGKQWYIPGRVVGDIFTSDAVNKYVDELYERWFNSPHADFSVTIPQEVAALYDRNGNLNEYIESLRVKTAQKCEALAQHLEESQNTINDVDGFWKNYLSSTFAGDPIENLAAANNTSVEGLLENNDITSPLQVYLGDDVTITTEDGDKRLTLVDSVFLDALAASQGWASAEIAYAQLAQGWSGGSLLDYDPNGFNWLPADIYAAYAKDNALTGGMTAGMFDKYADNNVFLEALDFVDSLTSDLADSFSLDNFSNMSAMFGQSTQTADFLMGDILSATINSTGGGGDWDLDWNWKSGSDNGSYDTWDISRYYEDYSSIFDTGGGLGSSLYSYGYWDDLFNISYDYINSGDNTNSTTWDYLNYDFLLEDSYPYSTSSFHPGTGSTYASYSGNDNGSNFNVGGSWSNDGGGGYYFSMGFSFPIAIDLDNDGDVTLVPLENSPVFFDMDGDEYKENTGWVAANDGILVYDMDGDQEITKAKELSFKLWSDEAETDFDGLRLMFDTSGNNKLDSADENFDKFYIWQDQNQDGQVDEGELFRLLKDVSIDCMIFLPDSSSLRDCATWNR